MRGSTSRGTTPVAVTVDAKVTKEPPVQKVLPAIVWQPALACWDALKAKRATAKPPHKSYLHSLPPTCDVPSNLEWLNAPCQARVVLHLT